MASPCHEGGTKDRGSRTMRKSQCSEDRATANGLVSQATVYQSLWFYRNMPCWDEGRRRPQRRQPGSGPRSCRRVLRHRLRRRRCPDERVGRLIGASGPLESRSWRAGGRTRPGTLQARQGAPHVDAAGSRHSAGRCSYDVRQTQNRRDLTRSNIPRVPREIPKMEYVPYSKFISMAGIGLDEWQVDRRNRADR